MSNFGMLACVAAAGLLAAGAVMAQTPDIAGAYRLTSSARTPDGLPVCVEHWTLKPGGDFLIESGQEQVRGHWRLEGGEKDGWKIGRRDQATNGRPDCTGRQTTGPLKDQALDFYFNVDHNLVLSDPPGRNADGSLIYQPDALLTKVGQP